VVVRLGGSDQLRVDFNARNAAPRIVSVVSPTCEDCLAGLTVVLDGIVGDPSIVALVLWVAMLSGDGPDAAAVAATRFSADGSALHYWEEEGWPVSTRLRPVLGLGPHDAARSAWDVYLLYEPGIEWLDDDPPVPNAWAYNTRDDLPSGERLTQAVVAGWLNR
jgi:hypothetical protein